MTARTDRSILRRLAHCIALGVLPISLKRWLPFAITRAVAVTSCSEQFVTCSRDLLRFRDSPRRTLFFILFRHSHLIRSVGGFLGILVVICESKTGALQALARLVARHWPGSSTVCFCRATLGRVSPWLLPPQEFCAAGTNY